MLILVSFFFIKPFSLLCSKLLLIMYSAIVIINILIYYYYLFFISLCRPKSISNYTICIIFSYKHIGDKLECIIYCLGMCMPCFVLFVFFLQIQLESYIKQIRKKYMRLDLSCSVIVKSLMNKIWFYF